MMPMMRPPAAFLAELAGEPRRVLDIAAGHGLFGITIARRSPQTRVVAVDWVNVLALARENAQAAGLDGRYETLPGSAFEVDLGSGYDLALLTNFLHHFDPPTCQKLLERLHRVLVPGGRVLTLEMVPNADRVTPPAVAAFSLMMLGTTEAGDAYTFSQYEAMFGAAGFSRSELLPIDGSPQQVVVSYR